MNKRSLTVSTTKKLVKSFSIHVKDARGCIVVIHEVWGFNRHTKRACERLCGFGFSTIAPDLYSREKLLFTPSRIRQVIRGIWDLSLKDRYVRGKVTRTLERKGAPKEVIELATTLYNKKYREKTLSDLRYCAEYAMSRYKSVGVLGFSMGGGLSFKLAASLPRIRSCISFCGEPPTSQVLRKIRAPMLAIYASQDRFMNSRVPEFVQDALEDNKHLTVKIYAQAKHEFFNEMDKRDYNKQMSEDAWMVTRDFFERTLR